MNVCINFKINSTVAILKFSFFEEHTEIESKDIQYLKHGRQCFIAFPNTDSKESLFRSRRILF